MTVDIFAALRALLKSHFDGAVNFSCRDFVLLLRNWLIMRMVELCREKRLEEGG